MSEFKEVINQEIESKTDSIGTARLLGVLGADDYIEALKIMLELLQTQNKEVSELNTNWNSLKNWLSPDRCKPTYWDYMTAKSVIATMESLEGGIQK